MTVHNNDEAQIREMLAGQVTAMRTGDADRLASRYAPDSVTFDLAPPLLHTDASDPARRRSWFGTFDGPVDFEIRDAVITAGPDIAFCHSLNRLTATPRGATESFDLWFRATLCLRKNDGAWLITHEHTSTPFYMDGSFRASVDLKP